MNKNEIKAERDSDNSCNRFTLYIRAIEADSQVYPPVFPLSQGLLLFNCSGSPVYIISLLLVLYEFI